MDAALKPSIKDLFKQPRTFFFLIGIILFIMASCGGSRVQCQKMLEIVNQGQNLIQAKQNQYNATATQQLAQELKATAEQLQALKLSDRKLKAFQSQFIQVYNQLSQTLSEIGTTLKMGEQAPISFEGRKQLLNAKQKLGTVGETARQTGEQVDILINDITAYCPQMPNDEPPN